LFESENLEFGESGESLRAIDDFDFSLITNDDKGGLLITQKKIILEMHSLAMLRLFLVFSTGSGGLLQAGGSRHSRLFSSRGHSGHKSLSSGSSSKGSNFLPGDGGGGAKTTKARLAAGITIIQVIQISSRSGLRRCYDA
jgi:hypothetical protein